MNQVKLNKHPKRVKYIESFLHKKPCTLRFEPVMVYTLIIACQFVCLTERHVASVSLSNLRHFGLSKCLRIQAHELKNESQGNSFLEL